MDLTRDQIVERIGNVKNLPAFPEIVRRLEQETAREEASLQAAAKIIEGDTALAASFLKVANSAFYSPVEPARSVLQAVTRLGTREVRRLALLGALVSRLGKFAGRCPRRFWLHSFAVAQSARILAEVSKHAMREQEQDEVHTAALLHDLGVLLIFHHFRDAYQELEQHLHETGRQAWEAEMEWWGIEHGEVGEFLARAWKLPDSICQVIRHHHYPWDATHVVSSRVHLVHLADHICNHQGLSRTGREVEAEVDSRVWEVAGIPRTDVDQIIARVFEEAQRSQVFLAFEH